MQAMASQSASPREAAIAQAWLDAHPAPPPLGREQILRTPDERASVQQVSYYDSRLGAWVVMEVNDYRPYTSSSTSGNGGYIIFNVRNES